MRPDFLFRKTSSIAEASHTGQQLGRAQDEAEALERLGFQTRWTAFSSFIRQRLGRVVVSPRASQGFHVEKQLETILSPQEKQIRARVSNLKL